MKPDYLDDLIAEDGFTDEQLLGLLDLTADERGEDVRIHTAIGRRWVRDRARALAAEQERDAMRADKALAEAVLSWRADALSTDELRLAVDRYYEHRRDARPTEEP